MSKDDERTLAVEREIFMTSISIAAPPPEVASQIARSMRSASFPKNGVLFEEGTASDDFYFIMSGTVEMTREGEEPWTFDEGSSLGILDALLERPHARTAVAVTEVTALAMRADDYFEVMEDNFEFSRDIVRGLSLNMFELGLTAGPTGGFVPPDLRIDPDPDAPDKRNIVERMIVLRETQPFNQMPIQALVIFSEHAQESLFLPGQPLFKKDAPSTHLWVVAEGEVRVAHPQFEATFGPFSLIGGYAAFAPQAPGYLFDARAISTSRVLSLSFEDFFDVMEEHFRVAKAVFAYSAREREKLMNVRARVSRASRPPATSLRFTSGEVSG